MNHRGWRCKTQTLGGDIWHLGRAASDEGERTVATMLNRLGGIAALERAIVFRSCTILVPERDAQYTFSCAFTYSYLPPFVGRLFE